MFKNSLKSLFWFILYFVFQTVGFVIMAGINVFSNMAILETDNADLLMENLTNILYSSAVPALIIGSILYFIVFIIYKLIRKHPFEFKSVELHKILFMICLGLVANAIITVVLALIIEFVPASWVNSLDESTNAALMSDSVFMLFIGTGILVPILEELVFRYGMCGVLARSNAKVGLIVSSIMFGIMHGNIIQGTYAAILGLFLGYIYLKTNNIWYSSFIHMALNSSSVFVSVTEAYYMFAVFAITGIIGIISLIKQYPELKEYIFLSKKDVYIDDDKDIL